jgi:hypothetical protein
MKFSTLSNLVKTQLPARVLLSILAVSLCFGASDRASAISETITPSSSTAPINPASTIPGAVTPIVPASTCANVSVNIQNGTPDTVKVTKFEYFDKAQNTFVEKNLLGPSGQQQLSSGTVYRATRDLAQIDSDRTQFRVTYRHKQGASFAAPVIVTTDRFRCIDGSTHPVLLNL